MYFNAVLIKDKKEIDYDWNNDVAIMEDYFYVADKGMVLDASEVLCMSPDIYKNDSVRYAHFFEGYNQIAILLENKSINIAEAIAMAKALETI